MRGSGPRRRNRAEKKFGSNEPSKYEAPAVAKPQPSPQVSENNVPVVETADGDVLNVVLGYEPGEAKHLNTTTFDAYLVNDSNYYLYVVYATRGDSREWTCHFSGIVEPNIQVHLEELRHEDLPERERVAVQYVAFKSDKAFRLKIRQRWSSVLTPLNSTRPTASTTTCTSTIP